MTEDNFSTPRAVVSLRFFNCFRLLLEKAEDPDDAQRHVRSEPLKSPRCWVCGFAMAIVPNHAQSMIHWISLIQWNQIESENVEFLCFQLFVVGCMTWSHDWNLESAQELKIYVETLGFKPPDLTRLGNCSVKTGGFEPAPGEPLGKYGEIQTWCWPLFEGKIIVAGGFSSKQWSWLVAQFRAICFQINCLFRGMSWTCIFSLKGGSMHVL